jgi:hypothetical protein
MHLCWGCKYWFWLGSLGDSICGFLSSPYEGKLCCVEAGTRGVMVEFFKLKHGRSKHVFVFIF